MSKLNTLSLLLIIGGEIILVLIFMLVLWPFAIVKPATFFLDMGITMFIFALLCLCMFDLTGSVERVARRTGGMGLRWKGAMLYSLLAAGAVVTSFLMPDVPFRWWILIHLVLLFVLGIFFLLGATVNKGINDYEERNEARKSGLNDLSTIVSLLEVECRMKSKHELVRSVEQIKEELRFVTPSTNAAALNLEGRLASNLQRVAEQVRLGIQDEKTMASTLSECLTIIEMRKKTY